MKGNGSRSTMRAAWRTSLCCLLLVLVVNAVAQVNGLGRLVKKEDRRQIVSTNCGEISAVEIDFEDDDPRKQTHHLQFISLDPDSIFLPALLHADMVLYIHTGNGTLSYTDGDSIEETRVSKGDAYRLKSGSVFYIQSSQESAQTEKLRLFAIFSNAGEEGKETWVGSYSGIRDLFQGFDTRLLQAAFQTPEEVMEEITKAAKNEPIVHAHLAESAQKKNNNKGLLWKKETVFLRAFLEINGIDKDMMERNKKKDKHKDDKHKDDKHKQDTEFNLFKAKRNVENCDGWSTVVTPKDLHDVKEGLSIQAFMVNLKTGAMAGPHWNPSGTEIALVVEGRGMVRAVCSSNSECNNTRFLVEKGDVFAIPRSHPMAHISFNNESLVFMGFSVPTGARSSGPQFLAGKDSFLQVLDKRILELAFNVNNTTISRLMASKTESIQQCVSCAEEEQERMIDEEKERKSPEEEEEGEEMRREEERKRRQEEEEEEEEEMRREEERKRRQEEERKRSQEEEQERKRRQQEEEEEEEERSQEEEEEKRKRRPEEEEEEEERRSRQEEEEEEEEMRREKERKRSQEEEEGESEWEGWEPPSTRGMKVREASRKRRE